MAIRWNGPTARIRRVQFRSDPIRQLIRVIPEKILPRTAALYFLKVSRLNVADGRKRKDPVCACALAGLLATLFFVRRAWPLALLWTPAIFYVACIAWGSVPIYVPQWYPFGYYNVRYGLQLLPAVAVFAALLLVYIMICSYRRRRDLLL